MRAVVLVGGFGTRLRPLTTDVPKPMLPVGHRPIIEHLIANLARGGVTDVTLALGFRPQPFIDAFPDGMCAGATLHYAVEPEPLDTAGAIRFAVDASGIDETFVVANGDILTDLDIAALIEFHRSHDAEATLHLIGVDDPSAFGVVELDEHDRVRRFVEKPAPGTAPSNLINAGTYVLEPSVAARIPVGVKTSIERVTFPQIAADDGLYALATDDYWIDTGRPELYRAANLDLLRGVRVGHDVSAIHAEAQVDPTAEVVDSIVGAGVVVGAGAQIHGSVLLSGATIGRGAIVDDSVIMGRVGEAAVVRRCVFGAAGSAAPSEQVADERRPPAA